MAVLLADGEAVEGGALHLPLEAEALLEGLAEEGGGEAVPALFLLHLDAGPSRDEALGLDQVDQLVEEADEEGFQVLGEKP